MQVNSRSILISTARFIACFEIFLSLISYLVNLRQPSHFPPPPPPHPFAPPNGIHEIRVEGLDNFYFYSCNNVICVPV